MRFKKGDLYIKGWDEFKFLYYSNNYCEGKNKGKSEEYEDTDVIKYKSSIVLKRKDDTIWIVPEKYFKKNFKLKGLEGNTRKGEESDEGYRSSTTKD